MTIHEKLVAIQSDLKAPKSQRNDFGKYNYRSCEDILEAVKPLANAQGCIVTLTDDVVAVGTRVYVKATATIADDEKSISVDAFAREAEDQKGMSASQITGAASSYARKYALNGLFCIDDTKDADATNDHKESKTTAKQKPSKTKALEFLTSCATPEALDTVYKRLMTYDWGEDKADIQQCAANVQRRFDTAS